MGTQGEYDCPVKVMDDVQKKKDEAYSINRVGTRQEKYDKHKQGGKFHDHPTQAVRDHGAPSLP